MKMDLKVLGCVLVLFSVVSSQVLNGYINPMWMSRRGRARNYDWNAADYFVNSQQSFDDSGLYFGRQQLPMQERRRTYDGRVSDLLYMDERGRYHPVYQQDRLYNTGLRQPMYRVNEQQPQYVPMPVGPSAQVPVQSQSILSPASP